MTYLPITQHGLIGDLHTAALIGVDGRLVWLPWPRFDSPSLFAALLDDERGGEWLFAPSDVIDAHHTYDGETAVLLTRFTTTHGAAELCDWMTPWEGTAPNHDLFRVLRCTAGEIEVISRVAPRPNYARDAVTLAANGTELHFVAHGLPCFVSCNQPWADGNGAATVRATLRVGEELRCVLSSGVPTDPHICAAALDETRAFWHRWIERCTYNSTWAAAVRRSAITLKLLTYAPSGAIIAAPTTSLPEWIGGVRNWDYRYTWIRDASFTLYAFYLLGYHDEAQAFFGWLNERARQHTTPLQIMYGVGGEADLREIELPHLRGYRGSRPVRIGNGAFDQSQLDVYGGLVDATFLYERYGSLLTEAEWLALREEIDYVCGHWHEPDHGIWEVRGANQHYTFSKVMCWVTLDRGIRLADNEGWSFDRERWITTRDLIHAAVIDGGWNAARGAFTMQYGGTALDASLLVMPLVGFLPADDARVRATIDQIDRELSRGALVYRYRADDGLPGDEGAFLLCSFWMVDALIMLGRIDEAITRFEQLLRYAGPLGLLAEEVDPATGTALGNYPQAFSHIGLINSALNLARAQRKTA